MKNLILCAIASLGLISLAACSDDSTNRTSTTTSQSASMQTDTKEMHSTH